jgi:hypothetical protein
VSVVVAADDYVVSEFDPAETNCIHTTLNPVNVTVDAGETETVEFGNLCPGPGGGHAVGFWSNKNGLATMNDAVRFVRSCGSSIATGLLSATATNMSYMLSAQLAAMELNVEPGFVNGAALVYAPGTNSANGLGFAKVSD